MEEAQSTVPSAAVSTAPSPSAQKLAHFGMAGELFAITLINLLLKVVTLGIYHFWGKTRVRQYVWSHTRFAGEQFEYVGRATELLRGYAIVMVILLPAAAGWQFVLDSYVTNPMIAGPASLVGYAGFIFFSGLALFSSRRYLLSRTRWRGVRFGMSGSALAHGRKTLIYSILLPITLGIYFPFMRSNLFAHMVGNSWVGDRRVAYGGRGRELLGPFIWFALLNVFIVGIFLSLFAGMTGGLATLLENPENVQLVFPGIIFLMFALGFGAFGINWLWYRAREFRYFLDHMAMDNVQVRTEFSDWSYVWLRMSNLLALALTLGLAYPWAVVRTVRFWASHVHLEGELDLAAIQQTAQQVPKGGEGLAEAFDLGSI